MKRERGAERGGAAEHWFTDSKWFFSSFVFEKESLNQRCVWSLNTSLCLIPLYSCHIKKWTFAKWCQRLWVCRRVFVTQSQTEVGRRHGVWWETADFGLVFPAVFFLNERWGSEFWQIWNPDDFFLKFDLKLQFFGGKTTKNNDVNYSNSFL